MALPAAATYDKIDRPYNADMQRSEFSDTVTNIPGTTQEEGGRTIKTGEAFADMWIDTWIKSRTYQPKSQGFFLDAKDGSIECMKLYVGNGGIIGGSLNIPDMTSANSFHVNNQGDAWWGANIDVGITGASASIMKDGKAKFTDIVIDGSGGGNALFTGDITASQITGSQITCKNGSDITSTMGNDGIDVYVGGHISMHATGGSSFSELTFDSTSTSDGWSITFPGAGGGGYQAGDLLFAPNNSSQRFVVGWVGDSIILSLYGTMHASSTISTGGDFISTGNVQSLGGVIRVGTTNFTPQSISYYNGSSMVTKTFLVA